MKRVRISEMYLTQNPLCLTTLDEKARCWVPRKPTYLSPQTKGPGPLHLLEQTRGLGCRWASREPVRSGPLGAWPRPAASVSAPRFEAPARTAPQQLVARVPSASVAQTDA